VKRRAVEAVNKGKNFPVEEAEIIKMKNKCEENVKKIENKLERRNTSMKLLFPGRPSSSDVLLTSLDCATIES
jgi:hypothetical protein